MSRYHDVYAAWQRDPLAFWAAAASAIDWFKPWEAVLAGRRSRPLVRRGGMQHRLELSRPPRRRRSWRAGCPHPHSPGHRHQADIQLPRAARRGRDLRRRSRRARRRQGRRVLIYMPMMPEAVIAMLAARGSAPFIRWCSAASRGRARNAHRRCQARGHRPASCGIEVERVDRLQAAARQGDCPIRGAARAR